MISIKNVDNVFTSATSKSQHPHIGMSERYILKIIITHPLIIIIEI